MTHGNGNEDRNDRLFESSRRVVEELQDRILVLIDSCIEEHPECDLQAFPVAAGQAFVAQCLKTYGEQGFDAARKHTQLIVETMERASQEESDEL
jgi:hypothetical protein